MLFVSAAGCTTSKDGQKEAPEFPVPFINLEYWTGLREKDLRTDMFFRQETIDDFLVMLAEENIFMITLYGEDKKPTDYFGSAENAAEYDEVMERLEEYWGQIFSSAPLLITSKLPCPSQWLEKQFDKPKAKE